MCIYRMQYHGDAQGCSGFASTLLYNDDQLLHTLTPAKQFESFGSTIPERPAKLGIAHGNKGQIIVSQRVQEVSLACGPAN